MCNSLFIGNQGGVFTPALNDVKFQAALPMPQVDHFPEGQKCKLIISVSLSLSDMSFTVRGQVRAVRDVHGQDASHRA